jgi:hypothetical protein
MFYHPFDVADWGWFVSVQLLLRSGGSTGRERPVRYSDGLLREDEAAENTHFESDTVQSAPCGLPVSTPPLLFPSLYKFFLCAFHASEPLLTRSLRSRNDRSDVALGFYEQLKPVDPSMALERYVGVVLLSLLCCSPHHRISDGRLLVCHLGALHGGSRSFF